MTDRSSTALDRLGGRSSAPRVATRHSPLPLFSWHKYVETSIADRYTRSRACRSKRADECAQGTATELPVTVLLVPVSPAQGTSAGISWPER